MGISSYSVRRKMLLPALIAAVATLVATGVTLTLSRRAMARLERVESKDFPALQFFQDMHASLQRLHLTLQAVGLSEDAKILALLDAARSDVTYLVQASGPAALGTEAAGKLGAELAEYYDQARAQAARSARAAGKAGPADAAPALPARASAEANEIEALYSNLDGRFAEASGNARATMREAFAEARSRERWSVLSGAVILLASALGSFLLAFWLSGRTSRPLRTLSEVALRIAEGDLTQDVKVETQDEVGVLAASFQRMVARLRDLVGTLKATSQELAVAAEHLSDHTRAQSAMLERQASGVAETSTTTRELEQTSSVAATRAASVLEVAKRAAEMSEAGRIAAERSAVELIRIQGSVESIVGQSSQLLEQARQVSDIVETVRDLATQSHVLSLNASIEAAKAGEAGKSFAVVAQEVRALAEQSGQSATRIAKIVQDILSAVQSTREITEKGSQGMSGSLAQVRASGESLREIGGIVRETSDAALQIASAVQQQSTGIAQISIAMHDLDKGMEETIGRIRSLEQSAQQVAESATRISGIADEFQV